ncbi:MAG: RadC family protein [Chloroflexia bacterium]
MNEKGRTTWRTLRELPAGERPRERLGELGPAALSDAELLAILLRTGMPGCTALDLARELLCDYGGLDGLLRAGFGELARRRGLGPAKAAQIKAALELGRRLLLLPPGRRLALHGPEEVAALLRLEMAYLDQEQIRVLLLDARHQVIRQVLVYQGNVNSAPVRVGEIFREAVRENCAAVLVIHNHPSGDPSPSPEDIAITREIVEAGRLLSIEVLDHLIIGRQGYVSLRDRGLGFPAR